MPLTPMDLIYTIGYPLLRPIRNCNFCQYPIDLPFSLVVFDRMQLLDGLAISFSSGIGGLPSTTSPRRPTSQNVC